MKCRRKLFLFYFLLISLFSLPYVSKAQNGAIEKLAAAAKSMSFSCSPDETVKGKILLQWSIVGEAALSHFVLERSFDGKHFFDAATIFADDNALNIAQYKFRDVKVAPRSGKVYYRFRLVHTSGEVYNSEIWIYKVPKRQKEQVEYSS